MSSSTKQQKCAHPACRCMVDPAAKYCSEYCKTAGNENSCECGHNGCKEKTEKSAA